jgi:hypothetical protein
VVWEAAEDTDRSRDMDASTSTGGEVEDGAGDAISAAFRFVVPVR